MEGVVSKPTYIQSVADFYFPSYCIPCKDESVNIASHGHLYESLHDDGFHHEPRPSGLSLCTRKIK